MFNFHIKIVEKKTLTSILKFKKNINFRKKLKKKNFISLVIHLLWMIFFLLWLLFLVNELLAIRHGETGLDICKFASVPWDSWLTSSLSMFKKKKFHLSQILVITYMFIYFNTFQKISTLYHILPIKDLFYFILISCLHKKISLLNGHTGYYLSTLLFDVRIYTFIVNSGFLLLF